MSNVVPEVAVKLSVAMAAALELRGTMPVMQQRIVTLALTMAEHQLWIADQLVALQNQLLDLRAFAEWEEFGGQPPEANDGAGTEEAN